MNNTDYENYNTINLLSPQYSGELSFERKAFSINISNILFLDSQHREYQYDQQTTKHPFLYELNVVLKGCCHFEIGNNEPLIVPQGCFIIIPPKLKHRIVYENNLSRVKFCFFIDKKDEFYSELIETSKNILENKLVFSYSEQMQTLLSLMLDCSKKMPLEYKTSIFMYAVAYIMEALRIVSKEEKRKETEKQKLVNRAIEYINLNISASLGVSDVTEYLNISRKQFSKIFSEIMGISPGKYIKNCRISQISNFLLFSDLSISDIVETMGYPDYSSLVNAFKRAKGITPTQYKKQTKSKYH